MAGDAIDAYLTFFDDGKLPNNDSAPFIKGETQDSFEKGGEDWSSIQIKSYEFSFDLNFDSEEMVGDKGKQPHEPQVGDVTITKIVDRATPMLLRALWFAAQYDEVALWQRRAGAREKKDAYFWKISLYDVAIKSLRWSASADDPYPQETLALRYRGLELDYFSQTHTGQIDIAKPTSSDYLELVRPNKDGGNGAGSDLSDADLTKRITAILKKPGFKKLIS